MKQRQIHLDILRIIACMMVVLMHSPMPRGDAVGQLYGGVSYLTSPCIGLFFMVSGALLLPPPVSEFKSCGMFLRRRIGKVLLPTLCWTVFYLCVKMFEDGMDTLQLLRAVCSIPFSCQGHGVLWFMYTLAGLYFLVPILARWLSRATEREVRFYLLLWGISLLYPILSKFLLLNETNTGIFYYFTGYAGYFLLGWYLQNYGCPFRLRHLLPIYVLCIAAPIVVKTLHLDVDIGEVFWYLSVFVALQCLTWYKAVTVLTSHLSIGEKTMTRIATLSNLTFGIYLSHIFLMRNVVWNWDWIKAIAFQPLQIVTIFVLTLVFSTALSALLCRTPLGAVVVGWRRKSA